MLKTAYIPALLLFLALPGNLHAQDMFEEDTLTGESEDAETLWPLPLPEFDEAPEETEPEARPLFPVPFEDAAETEVFPHNSFPTGRTIVTGPPAQPPVVLSPAPLRPPIVNAPTVAGNQLAARHIGPRLYDYEFRDFGVAAIPYLYPGPMFGPTPLRVPGAGLIATQDLAAALTRRKRLILIDVMGSDAVIPGALQAPGLSASGAFDDRVQRQAQRWLDRVTGGRPDLPIVVYCADPGCWHGYNAALRVKAAGYRDVRWYRGGLKAWEMAGFETVPYRQ